MYKYYASAIVFLQIHFQLYLNFKHKYTYNECVNQCMFARVCNDYICALFYNIHAGLWLDQPTAVFLFHTCEYKWMICIFNVVIWTISATKVKQNLTIESYTVLNEYLLNKTSLYIQIFYFSFVDMLNTFSLLLTEFNDSILSEPL